MANLVSDLALLAWVPITLGLFLKLRPAVAASVSLLGAGLLLPVGYGPDLPGLPPLSRERIAVLLVLGLTIVRYPRALRGLRRRPWILLFPLIMVLSPIIGALTNSDAYLHLHAMTLKDGITVAEVRALDLAIPFVLGLALVRRKQDVRTLLLIFCAAALLYSLLVLFEVRMSPKLHREFYGYLPQSNWAMAKRFGGWRPMVFMPHGIALARFLLLATLASAALYRARRPILRLNPAIVTAYLAVVLVLAKSFGVIAIGAALLPLVLTLSARRQAVIVTALAVLVIVYPAARIAGLFPAETLVSSVALIAPERSKSLNFRFYNEELLIEHALERPLFGWGGWARNRTYDPVTLKQLTRATDGYWIVIFGYHGFTGLAGMFGMLLLPALLAARAARRVRSERLRFELVGLAMLVTVNALDLLPNGFLMTFMVFASGALVGVLPDVLGQRSPSRSRRLKPTIAPEKVGSTQLPARVASLAGPNHRSTTR